MSRNCMYTDLLAQNKLPSVGLGPQTTGPKTSWIGWSLGRQILGVENLGPTFFVCLIEIKKIHINILQVEFDPFLANHIERFGNQESEVPVTYQRLRWIYSLDGSQSLKPDWRRDKEGEICFLNHRFNTRYSTCRPTCPHH